MTKQTPQEVYDEWTAGDSAGVRPQRVQLLRPALLEYTGFEPPHQLHEIRDWLTPQIAGRIESRLEQAVAKNLDQEDGGDDVESEGDAEKADSEEGADADADDDQDADDVADADPLVPTDGADGDDAGEPGADE